MIVHAGDQAVAAFLAYLNESRWSPSTRTSYERSLRRFFAWAERGGLSLASIRPEELAGYRGHLALWMTADSVAVDMTPLRGLFRQFVRAGVLAVSPFESGCCEVQAAEPSVPLAELKQAVRELDDWEEDSEFFQAGLVMLAPTCIGTTDPRAISRYTGVSLRQVREYLAV
jgi:site-specific recombinase XerD